MSKSPFPGMDPYLEQAWRDVHNSLCTYSRDEIQSQLSGGLLARVDERFVEQAAGIGRSVHGDMRVVHRNRPKSESAGFTSTGVALAEPITLEIADEMATEGFIEIIDIRTGGKVITVIEFLSITNKVPGPGQDQYRRKRVELESGGVSLVEINLLRSGPFIETFPEAMLHPENRTPYYVIVHRGWARRSYQYYPIALADRLPAIAIPLRETDAVVALDIQGLIDRVYRNGAYDIEIDYAKNPDPPLEGQAAEWANALLKEAGAR